MWVDAFHVSQHSASPCRLAETLARRVAAEGLTLARGFRLSLDHYLAVLSQLGHPLPYYGPNPNEGTHPRHPAVHRVRYDAADAERGALHAVDGCLTLHSAQSLREPRPRFFSMLMIDPGWLDGAPGSNGETILVRWRDAFREMARRNPDSWRETVDILASDVPLTDDVRKPVVYRLADGRDEFDMGVRVKYAMERNAALAESRASAALNELLDCAAAPGVIREGQLYSGDLLVLDNDRCGHGRRRVIGQRTDASGSTFNPRELWSVTVG